MTVRDGHQYIREDHTYHPCQGSHVLAESELLHEVKTPPSLSCRFVHPAAQLMRLAFSALFKTGTLAPGKEGPVILNAVSELSFIGYFQRSSALEMFTFFSRTFANNKSLAVGARTSVKQQGYQCHLYVSPLGVTAVCFADDEYPARVAFGYLSKLCEDLVQATGGQLPNSLEDDCLGAFQVRLEMLLRTCPLMYSILGPPI